jgi:molybdopterin-containing oxidoreductase family iron-sulfur binding subunit
MKESESLNEIRARLQGSRGASYWRSLDELAGTNAFRELLHREFPRHASEWDGSLDRRRFVQLASASLALAGLAGCTRQPIEKIVPYVRQPEQLVPGKPLYFATVHAVGGYATGLLAESHNGRPTKLEGNPEHPASLGRSDVRAQAAVLDLYDPDRSQAVTHLGQIRTWGAFVDAIGPKVTALKALEGEGLRLLTGTVTSPTVAALVAELRAAMPKARWHQHEAAGRDHVRRGALAAFGKPVETRYDLSRADVVVALDSDFLTQGPGAVRYALDFARRRKVHDLAAARRDGMSRLYAVESGVTATGTVADHRLAVRPTEVAHFALALAARLGVAGSAAPPFFADGERAEWVDAVAEDLQAHRGRCLVLAGDEVDAEVHTLLHAVNAALGNAGTTVIYTEPVEAEPVDQAASLAELVADARAGAVDTLVILGANPVYDAPADVDLAAALAEVPLSVHLGSHVDETAGHCHWHLPEAHQLETWTDARAFDGTTSIGQPLIEPLYGGKTAAEVLAVFLGRTLNAHELLREHWQTAWQTTGADFETRWRRALHDGLVADSAAAPAQASVDAGAAGAAAAAIAGWTSGELELAFRPDPHLFDGRFANNGWLQECPRPITKLTWENALLMSPATARGLGLGDLTADGDQYLPTPVVELTVDGRGLEIPVWVVPGHADGALTLHLGYGRDFAGRVAAGAGVNACAVRAAAAPWRVAQGVAVRALGRRYRLASTQDHHSMEGRHIVLGDRFDNYLEHPEAYKPHLHVDPSLTLMPEDEFVYDGNNWGMSVDLTACTGCNACVVACQAENNVPVVGKDQVAKGREMHWIRIDRYYQGVDADRVEAVLHQPVLCMHCEQAPCEVVCPVAATVHSADGLNDMIYNRCVGTRYCSNNCPYKVRRFNFLLYQDWETPSLQLGRNPDVTVRSRGVMEKCTYCVQRISRARIAAKMEDREIRDGEVVTACQQACPSDALVFGDMNDPGSAVARAKASPLDYSLLEELGTRPHTTFLARIRNPNPKLEPPRQRPDHGAHA